MTETETGTDFTLSDHGSLCVLTPITEPARDWVDEHIDPDAMMWASGVVVEPRYLQTILDGIAEDGLTVAR